MGRTHKDSARSRSGGGSFEVVKRDDGYFDLFHNRRLEHAAVPESGLQDFVCVRFGFCADEYEAIMAEVGRTGRKFVEF
jgi:hypothetical protein